MLEITQKNPIVDGSFIPRQLGNEAEKALFILIDASEIKNTKEKVFLWKFILEIKEASSNLHLKDRLIHVSSRHC